MGVEKGNQAGTQHWDKHTACSKSTPSLQEPNPLPGLFYPVPGTQVPVAPLLPG